MSEQCGQPTEYWSRVTGYFRPVKSWNKGKKEEFKERTPFKVPKPKPTIRKIDEGYDPQTGKRALKKDSTPTRSTRNWGS